MKEVIDTTVRENRSWEWLSYALTFAIAVVRLAVLVNYRGQIFVLGRASLE
jgi:hypothetical protein